MLWYAEALKAYNKLSLSYASAIYPGIVYMRSVLVKYFTTNIYIYGFWKIGSFYSYQLTIFAKIIIHPVARLDPISPSNILPSMYLIPALWPAWWYAAVHIIAPAVFQLVRSNLQK